MSINVDQCITLGIPRLESSTFVFCGSLRAAPCSVLFKSQNQTFAVFSRDPHTRPCTGSLRPRRQRERPRSTGDSEENHHFIWHLGPSCVAKRSREHFKSKQGVCLTPTLEHNAPLSRCTVSLCSRRQRERPYSTGRGASSRRGSASRGRSSGRK